MNLLEQAIREDDLDVALYPLQQALGIESGDVAAQAFSGYDDAGAAWRAGDGMARRDMLANWLRVELVWAVP